MDEEQPCPSYEIVLTALLLRRNMRVVVTLNPVKELLPALRVLDVLNTDVHALLNVAVTDDLVDDNADSAGRDIVDNTSAALGSLGYERFGDST